MRDLLFIDDEEGVRRSLLRALKREPYETHTVSSGQEGIDFVKTHREHVATVISDYKMPGMDGLETLQAIGGLNPEITRIILTGYATMEAAINATNAGIDGFLTKPFDNTELRAKIHEIWVRKHLRQFVSEQIYAEINKSPAALAPRYHNVTVLFSDIRGFTRMSQRVTPEELVAFLNNHYFTPMGEIAYEHQGTMDKHIGDSMMVVFGSPVVHPDDALHAVHTAIAMQVKAREIDTALPAASALRLRTGIGIASGKVFSGVMGSLRKKEFTSVGLPVNIAARLQSLAQGGEILLDETTYLKITGQVDAEPLPPVTVKGLDAPIQVYRIKIS
jgi:adenylate cyclase